MPSDLTMNEGCEALPAPATGGKLADFLPAKVCRQLAEQDLVAIEDAARQWMRERGRSLPVDIRFSIPLPFRGIFVNVMAGGERRSKNRRRTERRRRPLATAGNVIFTASLVGLMYTGMLVGTLVFSGIVE